MMRRIWIVLHLLAVAPIFFVGAILVPFWALDRACFRICRLPLFRFVAMLRGFNPVQAPVRDPLHQILAKQRQYRRHQNRRIPRGVS